VGLENDQYSAHVRLWGAVIKLAIRDARRLRDVGGRRESPKWEQRKYGRLLTDTSPQEFFDSDWFEEICRMTGASPETIRAAIRRAELEEMIDD